MYEIPQQLEYKEKIVFGLNFKQLAYSFGFFPILFLLFFKLNANIYVRFFLILQPTILAIGFIFFDLESHLKKWIIWYKLKEIQEKEKIEEFFQIKKIDENLIFTKKNKLAVLKIDPINFDIKPKKEQETITLAFQKFLNSLDFPIQILMTTENLSLEDYLKSLESRINNKNSKEIFKEYEKHMQDLINKNSVSNRNFYIIIPEKIDIDIQIKICEERLHGLNLKTYRLHNNQLRNFLIQIFDNPNEESYLPEEIENKPSYVKINGKLSRTIYAHGYPRIVQSGFLDRIVSSLGDFNLSLHIEPLSLESTMILLNKELQKQRADLYAAKIKNQLNPSLEIKYKDTLKTLEDLQKGNEKLFNISFYITCKADTEKELDLLTKKVESELNSLLIIPREADFRMIQGFKSCMPLCDDSINMKRNITTKGLSAFFPFTSSFFKFDETGIWFGLNKNGIPIIRDVFNLSNANGICLASSGAGKSYMAKLFISRYLLNGTKVMVIDPQGEYRKLVNHFNGQLINLSRNSQTMINPLDLMGHNYFDKRLSLIDLMKVMLGEITEVQKAIIDKALTKTYELKGINENSDTWNNTPPILGDLLHVLERMEKDASSLEKTTLRSLINRLSMYVHGVFSFFNQHTNINFDNNFVCFDIGNLPSQVKPSMMFLVLDYIYTKMKSTLERKILLIDEAWSLLSRAEEAGYIFEIVKTCRKFNLGLLMINQEVEGLLDSKAGKSVLANSAYTFLMKQRPSVIDNICNTFHLSSSERTHLLTANVGEGILIMEDDHSEIKIIASPKEHKIITTNADERIELEKQEKVNHPDVNIRIDSDKRFFKKKELSQEEIKYLLSKGYKISEHKSLNSKRKEEFLLKPRFNESINHLFVTYDLANFLEKNGIVVQKFVTKKPDLVFDFNGKKYAIEIETGSVLSKIKNLEEKVKLLNKNYDEWFFVVTNRNKVKKYKKFGKAIDVRYLSLKLEKLLKNRQIKLKGKSNISRRQES